VIIQVEKNTYNRELCSLLKAYNAEYNHY